MMYRGGGKKKSECILIKMHPDNFGGKTYTRIN